MATPGTPPLEEKMKSMSVKEKKAPKEPKPEKAPQGPGKGAGGAGKEGGKEVKKETQLGLSVTRAADFGAWYSNVVTAGEMIEYYDVSGCYILRPWSYAIWERIKDHFDAEIKKCARACTLLRGRGRYVRGCVCAGRERRRAGGWARAAGAGDAVFATACAARALHATAPCACGPCRCTHACSTRLRRRRRRCARAPLAHWHTRTARTPFLPPCDPTDTHAPFLVGAGWALRTPTSRSSCPRRRSRRRRTTWRASPPRRAPCHARTHAHTHAPPTGC
jgi:hypothetical protein